MSPSRFLGTCIAPLFVLLWLGGSSASAQTRPAPLRPPVAAAARQPTWFVVNQSAATVDNGLIHYAHGTVAAGTGITAFGDVHGGDGRNVLLNLTASPPSAPGVQLTRNTANDQFVELLVQTGSLAHTERLYRDLPVLEIESTAAGAVFVTDTLSVIEGEQLIGVANPLTPNGTFQDAPLQSSASFIYRDHRIYGVINPTTGHGIGFVTPTAVPVTIKPAPEHGFCFTLHPSAGPLKRWIFTIHHGEQELSNLGIAIVNGLILDRGPEAYAAAQPTVPVPTTHPAVLASTTLPWGRFVLDTDAAGHLQVHLENSVFRLGITQFNGGENEEHAIRELVLKQLNEDQGGRFIDAGAGRQQVVSAQPIQATRDVLTVELVYANNRITRLSIFPDSPVIRCHYVRGNVNIVDIGSPGGVAKGAQYVIYGAEHWHRPYVLYPNIFFTRYPGDLKSKEAPVSSLDPEDGGSLNYHGFYLMGLCNPANGHGFGRVVPVHRTAILKLLECRGFEIFPGRVSLDRGPSTQYLFVFTGGPEQMLQRAKAIADGNLHP